MSTLPPAFVEYIRRYPSLAPLEHSLTSTAPATAIRANTAKGCRPHPSLQPVPRTMGAGAFCTPPTYGFAADPAWHQGLYYVQDPSSMSFVEIAHRVARMVDTGSRPLRWLDACAAPGGKSTAIAQALQDTPHLLVCNEYDSRRANILAENIAKWGDPATVVTRGDTALPARLLPGWFDVVSADVPCSGEGMMRKDAVAVSQWSPALVAECAERQRLILRNLWETLRPGGILLYSTCTFNLDEDEHMVQYMVDTLGAESIALPLSDTTDLAPAIDHPHLYAHRFVPGTTRGEGLFVAALRKPDDGPTPRLKTPRTGAVRPSADDVRRVASWLQGDMHIDARHDGTLYAVPATVADDARIVLSLHPAILLIGCEAATPKGRDLIPTQALAMSTAMRQAFDTAEVSHTTALHYLARQAVTLPDGTPRGHVLLTHGSHPLGFVKNIGNRANNLYPEYWRLHDNALIDSPAPSPLIL